MSLVSHNAIQTVYAGCYFRSKLEARWAVFFDSLGIRWNYEPEGYKIGGTYPSDFDGTSDFEPRDVEWYLPDFYLPDLETWVEVKGQFGDLELDTCVKALDGFSLAGTLPNIEESRDKPSRGLLVLGEIPNPPVTTVGYGRPYGGTPGWSGSHVIFTQHKGVQAKLARFVVRDGVAGIEVGDSAPDLGYFDVTLWSKPGDIANDHRAYTYGAEEIEYLYKAVNQGLPREWDKIWNKIRGLDKIIKTTDERAYWSACISARSARFDKGSIK